MYYEKMRTSHDYHQKMECHETLVAGAKKVRPSQAPRGAPAES